MSPKFLRIHNECLSLARRYLKAETALVAQLQLVSKFEIHKKLGKRSLFLYAVDVCGLSEAQAYTFTSVARKSNQHQELATVLQTGELSVSKAARIVSVIDDRNASALIKFARENSSRRIEREVRRINPKAAEPQKISPLAEKLDLLHCPIDSETAELIRRAQALISQRKGGHQDLSQTIHQVFQDFVERHDPVKKAERVKARIVLKVPEQSAETQVSARAENRTGTPLNAAQIHQVNLRDERRCRQLIENGKRCNEDRWIDYHHIVPRKNGGSNHPDNLITLCRFHHDLIHRYEIELKASPIEPAQNNSIAER